MKIHHLRLQAFGPFAGAHEIDFDALGAAGLHLIHGATGSGKTSILDAVCFAIFGQVAGSRRGLGGPASAIAPPEVTPEVELDVTVAGRRLRFVRRPDRVRPKKRGSGVTTVRSSVALHEWRDGTWHPVSTRVQEVQHVVDTALGLQLDQFAQVIMLPQGGFAQFLHAEPDERSGVLRKLFDIERFTDIEQWFADERRRLSEQVTAARAPVDRALTVVELALADIPPDPEAAKTTAAPAAADFAEFESSADDELLQSVLPVVENVADRATTAAAQADGAEVAAREAHRRLERAERAATLRQRGEAARSTLADLDSHEGRLAHQATQHELDAAERAARVTPTWQRVHDCGKALQEACSAHAASIPQALRRTSADPARSDSAEHWWTIVQQATDVMRSSTERAEDAARAVRQVAKALHQVHELDLRRAELQRELDALATRRADCEAKLSAAHSEAESSAQAEELVRLVESATRRVAQMRHAGKQEALYASAVADAEESLTTATDHAAVQRRAHVAQLTGHLAADLVDGEPCAVCGSTVHPAPADLPEGGVVSAEDVEAAEESREAAKQAFDATVADLTSARSARLHAVAEAELALAAARSLAREHLSEGPAQAPVEPAEFDQWLHTLQKRAGARLTAIRESQRQASTLKDLRDLLHRDHETKAAELVECRLDHAAAQTKAREAATRAIHQSGAARTALAQHDRHCPCARTSSPDLPWWDGDVSELLAMCDPSGPAPDTTSLVAAVHARASAHEQMVTDLSTWRRAEQHLAQVRQQHLKATEELERLLAQEGFTDGAQVQGAARTADHRAHLRAQLDEAAAARTSALTVLEDREVLDALSIDEADLDELRDTATRLVEAARVDREHASRLERARGQLRAAARDLSTALETLSPLQRRHQSLDALAGVINAERGAAGDRRMRLSAYVLAARLEEVVRLANQQLGIMTAQRFSLEHDDGPGSRGTRGGLGLRVHDAWTGTSRPTRSLSGGETFLASLALALALGEAIQHDAGGRQLETLFIDEGFGSLDDDSLELVLEVLDQLRGGGRTVGIVSHVAELRGRIPAQIEVRKAESGSTVTVHLPGKASAA